MDLADRADCPTSSRGCGRPARMPLTRERGRPRIARTTRIISHKPRMPRTGADAAHTRTRKAADLAGRADCPTKAADRTDDADHLPRAADGANGADRRRHEADNLDTADPGRPLTRPTTGTRGSPYRIFESIGCGAPRCVLRSCERMRRTTFGVGPKFRINATSSGDTRR